MKPLIDIDDSATWPPHVHQIVSVWARQCAGKTNYTNDLPLQIELEAQFRGQLAGYLVRAFHYTRLLPHERSTILSQGLRVLSADLLSERIESARFVGAISSAEAAIFHKAHVFAVGEEKYREGQVCFVLSRRLFDRDPDACLPLLTTWGGEGLYSSSGSVAFRKRLKSLGVPTMIVAVLAIEDASKHKIYPALHKVFVGSLLRLPDVGADVFYRAAVPPKYIEMIEEVEDLIIAG
jgi:hypothetical protein